MTNNTYKLLPDKLIEVVRNLLTDDVFLDSVIQTAFESRSANELVFNVPAEISVTGNSLILIADRKHLTGEPAYQPGDWNRWPDVIPPRLNTEPFIEGKPLECDYWLLRLKTNKFMTGKLTTQKNWIQVPEDQIEAYREFSPYPAIATLNAKENFSDDGWNAYPKFVPKNGTYEVVLCDGRQRVCSWKSNVWSFYGDEIVAFKKII